MRRLVRRVWFPVALLAAVAVVFFAFGPPSAGNSGTQLVEMAPPGSSVTEYVPPDGATRTELEIAQHYNTVRQYPDTVDAYIMLGNAYVQHVREKADPQDYARAEAAFAEALRRRPDSADALIGLGVIALARHEFVEALAFGEQAIQFAPNTSRAHGVVVDALTELGRYDEAVVSAQRMVDLRPDLTSLSRVAYQRELHGDVAGAIDAMARAFDASAGAPSEQREYLRVLIGDLHLAQGDTATAQRIYSASLEVLPDFVWAHAGLARVATALGDHALAVEHYRAATRAVPLPEFLVPLGEAEQAAGMDDAAEDTFELVRAVQQLFVENGVRAELELALFEANHGLPARSLELAQAAFASQPNIKSADALSWALYRSGDLDGAQRYSAEALRLGSEFGSFHLHAGMIAAAAGDPEMARHHLSRALEMRGTISAAEAQAAEAALAEVATAP